MQDKAKSSASRKILASLLMLAVAVGVAIGGLLYGPVAVDLYHGSQFTPSSAVASIEQDIALTETGRRIFRATQPVIESGSQFNAHCQSTERTAAILGCYYRDRIYIFDVQNDELTSAEPVTAAHELLHAAYARLSVFEKPQIDAMIKRAYAKVKDDPTIQSAMEYYSQAEPGAELDELHSILGTTIANLDSDLENYYARYFTNRSRIVTQNQTYTEVFERVNQQAEAIQARITAAETQIKRDVETYQTDLLQLNSDIASFNQRANSGEFSSQADFAVARSALQNRIQALNTRQTALNARIAAYNDDVAELNRLAVKAQQLNQSINGVAAPTGVNNG